MENKIKCPNCGFDFDVDKVLEHQAEEKIRQELKLKFESEKNLLIEKAEKKGKEIAETELRLLKEENEKSKKENQALKRKEIELLKKEKEVNETFDNMRLQLEKEMLEKEDSIKSKAKIQFQEENELKFRQYEKQLEDQKKLIEEMKRKAEQGSMQMQGEVLELALEDFLRSEFPFDIIGEVAKGVKGADVIHIVRNDLQQECGKIIYESKRTKSFSEGWLEKLKDDQKSQQAEIAVIVTESMPKDMERFGQKNGIWICNYQEIKSLAFVLREMLIKTQTLKIAQENKGDKMELLYNYLVSTEFKQQVEGIVEGFSQLKSDIETEKRAMQKMWKEREKQIEKVTTNTIDMYGSIKGIAGSAIGNIKALELPEGE